MASGWSRSTGPGGRVAATGPRATPWMRSGPAAKRWPASTWPALASAASGGNPGAAHHPQRHRGGRRERSPAAQGADHHCPEPLRDSLRGRTWLQQARACAGLVAAPSDPVEHRATVRALGMTAQRVLTARAEAKELEVQLRMLLTAVAPVLLAQRGVGPISAAQVLISWSHPGRFRSEAAFAMLAGAAPVEASSGQVVRHRLNRGGDRQLNRALHTIVMIRQTHHGPTQTYTTRRIAQGKSQRDIRRCLKRTLARQLYRLLERTAANQAT